MKIKLIFNDWQNQEYDSIYNTEEGISLSMTDFHAGTTFNGEIIIDSEQEKFLKEAINEGYRPVFFITNAMHSDGEGRGKKEYCGICDTNHYTNPEH